MKFRDLFRRSHPTTETIAADSVPPEPAEPSSLPRTIAIRDRFTGDIRFEATIDPKLLDAGADLGAAVNQALAADIEMKDMDLHGADLRGLEYRFHFENCDLTEANLERIDAKRCSFERCILDRARFRDACLEHVDFTGASLRGTDFSNAKLEELSMENTDCTGANFTGVAMFTINARNAIFRKSSFSPWCCYGDFDQADFSDAWFFSLAFEVGGNYRLDETTKFDPSYKADFWQRLTLNRAVVPDLWAWLQSDEAAGIPARSLGLAARLSRLAGEPINAPETGSADIHPFDQGRQTPAAQFFNLFRTGGDERSLASAFARQKMLEWIEEYAKLTKIDLSSTGLSGIAPKKPETAAKV